GPLEVYAQTKFTDAELGSEGVQIAEVAIAPNASLLGRTIGQGDIRRRYGILVLALRRRQQVLHERFVEVPLQIGDVLLVQGTPDAIADVSRSPDFLVVNRLSGARRHPAKAPLALGIMALTILTAATGLLHISVAGL